MLVTSNRPKTWRVVDLIWISVGGISAATALLSSIYLTNVGETQRSINVLNSKVANLNSEARAAFARYCSATADKRLSNFYEFWFDELCLGVDSIVGETADSSRAFQLVSLISGSYPENRETSVFEEETKLDVILQGLSDDQTVSWGNAVFFSFDPNAPRFQDAYATLINSGIYKDFAIEFDLVKREYVSLKSEFDNLETVWASIREDRWYLGLRTLSLAVLAFCLPLRIGKSAHEIMRA